MYCVNNAKTLFIVFSFLSVLFSGCPAPNNEIPVANIDSVSGLQSEGTVVYGTLISFSGHGEDVDGRVAAYNWSSNINGFLSSSPSFTTSSLSVGLHNVTFSVQDALGAWSAPDSVQIRVTSRNPPVNKKPSCIIAVNATTAMAGEKVFFNSISSDEDGWVTDYAWRSDISGPLSSAQSFETLSMPVGVNTVYLKVKDNAGVWSDETHVVVNVLPLKTLPPTSEIVSVSNNSILESSSVTLCGHGTGRPDPVVAYKWLSSIDGPLGYGECITLSNLSVGDHLVLLRVQAANGLWSDASSAQVNVTSKNHAPTAIISIISPKSAAQNQYVTFGGYGLDPDGHIWMYEWSSDLQGVLSTQQSFESKSLALGAHVVSFRVRDDGNSWSQPVQDLLTVYDVNPEVPRAKINVVSPASPSYKGQYISFSGSGVTSKGAIIDYDWRSSIDGFMSNEQAFSTKNLSVGKHVIYFKVKSSVKDNWSPESAVFYEVKSPGT